MGTGATGNGYLLSAAETSGLTYAINSQFAGGVNGVDADTDLELINGGAANQMLILYNAMSANTISLKATGGGNMNQTYVQIQPLSFVQLYLIGGTWMAVQIGVWVEDRGEIFPAQPTSVWNGINVDAGGSGGGTPSNADYDQQFQAGDADGIYFISTIPKNYIVGISPRCDFFWRTDGVSAIAMDRCAIGHVLCAEGSVNPLAAAFSWTNFGLAPDGTANKIRMSTEFTLAQVLPYPPAVAPATTVRGYYRVAIYRNADGGQGGDANPDVLLIPHNTITVRYPVWTQSI